MVMLYTLWCSFPLVENSIRIGNRGGIRIYVLLLRRSSCLNEAQPHNTHARVVNHNGLCILSHILSTHPTILLILPRHARRTH